MVGGGVYQSGQPRPTAAAFFSRRGTVGEYRCLRSTVPLSPGRMAPCDILSVPFGRRNRTCPRRPCGDSMTEILTESFCERCGTRYTFESSTSRARRLGKFKTLSKGLKNFVLSDDTTLDEAMAAARSDDERDVTSQQLDAFHKTFNFCMSCRQYTCANCWNEVEGRCLSCAPHLGTDILAAPFPEMPTLAGIAAATNGHAGHGEMTLPPLETAWPGSDVDSAAIEELADAQPAVTADAVADASPERPPEAINAGAAEAGPEVAKSAEHVAPTSPEMPAGFGAPDPVAPEHDDMGAAPGPTVETPEAAAPEPAPAAPVAAETVESPVAADDAGRLSHIPTADTERVAAVASRKTDALLRRFRPGQSLDAAIAAFEAGLAEAETLGGPAGLQPAAAPDSFDLPEKGQAEASTEPAAGPAEAPEAAASAPEPIAVTLAKPAPLEPAATVEPAAEVPGASEPAGPVAAETEEPATAAPAPSATEPRDDRVEVPTWRIVAPDNADAGPPPPIAAPPTPARQAEPTQWPTTPEWPTQPDADPLGFLTARRATDAMWVASSQDLLSVPQRSGAAAPTPTVQSCVSCGLSLSATARFCRRCGARQEG